MSVVATMIDECMLQCGTDWGDGKSNTLFAADILKLMLDDIGENTYKPPKV